MEIQCDNCGWKEDESDFLKHGGKEYLCPECGETDCFFETDYDYDSEEYSDD